MTDGAPAPSFSDASAAMQAALVNANADTAPPVVEATPVVPTVETTPVEGTPTVPADATTTPVEFNLDGVDLSGLSEADLTKVKNAVLRQQDYTRKTQEIAPFRKFVEEAGSDLEHVRKSVDFVNRLENDPDFLRQVAQELQELASDGKAPGSSTEQPLVVPENTGLDPQFVKRLERMEAFEAEREQERINAGIVAEWETKIQTAENAVRESNPVYSDDDIKEIYDILPAHEFDFFKAQEHYERLRNRFETGVLGNKLNHPSAANPVNSGTGSTQAKEVTTIEDAARITRERLRQQA